MAGHSNDTGRYEVESSAGLPGFSSGMIVDVFHIAGIELVWIDRLKIFVKYFIPEGPRYFKCRLDILSGSSALDVFAFLIASSTCSYLL